MNCRETPVREGAIISLRPHFMDKNRCYSGFEYSYKVKLLPHYNTTAILTLVYLYFMCSMDKFTLIFVFLISASSFLKAQTTASSDDLFKNARDAVFEQKNYDKARLLAYEALEKSPAY